MATEEGVQELYPTERNAVISIKHELMQKHSFHQVVTEAQENAVKRAFEAEAVDRLGQIGLRAEVVWQAEVYEFPDGQFRLVWEPDLIIYERVGQIGGIDYERIQREVRAGEADGKVGVIREDGRWSEDPIKKQV